VYFPGKHVKDPLSFRELNVKSTKKYEKFNVNIEKWLSMIK